MLSSKEFGSISISVSIPVCPNHLGLLASDSCTWTLIPCIPIWMSSACICSPMTLWSLYMKNSWCKHILSVHSSTKAKKKSPVRWINLYTSLTDAQHVLWGCFHTLWITLLLTFCLGLPLPHFPMQLDLFLLFWYLLEQIWFVGQLTTVAPSK